MYSYKNIECNKMTEHDIEATSRLFSNNYGFWSSLSPISPNERIRFSPTMIKRSFVEKPDRYIAMVFDDDKLIGHAFYMRRTIPKSRKITWILQLVVDKSYRGQKIGTKLLHSIFQLSDSYACGLYTSNPMTIKALENATFRHINTHSIDHNIAIIKEVAKDIFDDTKWIDNYSNGIVNTRFFVDHSSIQKNINKVYNDRAFPLPMELEEGCEWLAFVFKSQKPLVDNAQQLNILTDYSDDLIKRSYSNMNMKRQSWTKHTEKETEYIIKILGDNHNILDIGCGYGRHSVALSRNGYRVTGIDFSEENIRIANINNDTDVKFLTEDARTFKSKTKFDACLAMYDVIGSFPIERDNIKIIKTAHRNLNKEGYFILSVMNMELTRNRCEKKGNVLDDFDMHISKLLSLPSSNTMQQTGDVFDGKYILIDNLNGICYRKEQFFSEDSLPEEYIVRDRRYTKKGIISMLHREGFSVEDIYCFNAKDITIQLSHDNKKAKEIFIVARKKGYVYKIFQRLFNKKDYWK